MAAPAVRRPTKYLITGLRRISIEHAASTARQTNITTNGPSQSSHATESTCEYVASSALCVAHSMAATRNEPTHTGITACHTTADSVITGFPSRRSKPILRQIDNVNSTMGSARIRLPGHTPIDANRCHVKIDSLI